MLKGPQLNVSKIAQIANRGQLELQDVMNAYRGGGALVSGEAMARIVIAAKDLGLLEPPVPAVAAVPAAPPVPNTPPEPREPQRGIDWLRRKQQLIDAARKKLT